MSTVQTASLGSHRTITAKCWRSPRTWRPMPAWLQPSPSLPSSARLWRKFTLKSLTGHRHSLLLLQMYLHAYSLCMYCMCVSSSHRYYGCGLVVPECLEGCRILDLGSGSGRDCYMLSQLVGEKGHVTGIDMTEDQVLCISIVEWLQHSPLSVYC